MEKQLTTDQPQNWDVVTIRNKAIDNYRELHDKGYPECMEYLVTMADMLLDECEGLPAMTENLNAMYATVAGMYASAIHIRNGMGDEESGCY